ncbi:MAG: sodium:proline symporter, partial [Clostridia bacterium]
SILGLVSYAWAGFGATFGPLVILSLFWRRTTLKGAIAGVFTGGVVTILWNLIATSLNFAGIFALYELVPGFVASLVAIIVISNLDSEPSAEILAEFDSYTSCEE